MMGHGSPSLSYLEIRRLVEIFEGQNLSAMRQVGTDGGWQQGWLGVREDLGGRQRKPRLGRGVNQGCKRPTVDKL
ncbi:Os04g0548525 [Oryza sativa Japonica Group]|uniref:Os04g0548525 protein n=1 Tax=Oryza sativa subsp. japonica TaxID=39947 RepID=A0A0P0WD69_ORYSJ|nr:Os04g0548525 [Oryza sativa Japonica Group]